jgi:MFS superfamily sulfate permease-like transporter
MDRGSIRTHLPVEEGDVSAENTKAAAFSVPVLQGVLPLKSAQIPAEIIAGITLAALAAVLAFMAAAFLIVARFIGLGFMANFLSRTVLIGFLTGVGIQVALGEISGMPGLKGGGHGTLQKIWNDVQQIEQINFYSLTIALTVLLVLLFLTGPLAYMPEAVLSAVVFLRRRSSRSARSRWLSAAATMPSGEACTV